MTSQSAIERVVAISHEITGTTPVHMRKVWKGARATKWQFWFEEHRKHELLALTRALRPYLVVKAAEAAVVEWFLTRSCKTGAYRAVADERELVNTLLTVLKRTSGEVPAKLEDVLREMIPSQALTGTVRILHVVRACVDEGVETTSHRRPADDGSHECPPACAVASR